MSPVHPSRSSRWGQSLGTSRKLPRRPQTVLACSWLSRSSEHAKWPVRRRSECTTTASRESAVRVAGPAADLRVAEPVERLGRLEEVVAPAEHEPVGGLGGPQRADAQLAVLEHLRVPQRDLVARLAAHREAQPADQVLPEVDQRPSRRRGPDLDRAPALVTDHGWSDVRRQPLHVERHGLDPHPPRRRGTGTQPGVVAQPRVDRLAVVEVVGEDLRRTRRPGLVGDHDLPVAVGEDDLELGDQAEPVAVEVAVPVPGQPSAVPAVAEREAQHRRRRSAEDVTS